MNDTFYARTDSSSANNPALNLTGAPAVQITFVPKTITGGPGDLILEQGPSGGNDPDTVVMINGVNYSFKFEFSGTLPVKKSNGAGQVPQAFQGDPVAVITVQSYPSAGHTMRLMFLPNGDATQSDMNAFGKGAINVQNVNTTPPGMPVCFAQDTLILTPRGEVAVQDLVVGDLVSVLDGPPMPVRWIGRSRYDWTADNDIWRPVVIAADAFGPGLPQRDLTVSPQHKMALCGSRLELDLALPEALAPAAGLVGHAGVRVAADVATTTYHHVLLDRHALLLAHGVASESFFPGLTAMNALNPMQRLRIEALFPGLKDDPEAGYGSLAMPVLKLHETERLARQRGLALVGLDITAAESDGSGRQFPRAA